jgi:hypothetical protein
LETFTMTSRLLKTVLAGGILAFLGAAPAMANGHLRGGYYGTSYVPSVLAVPTSYVSTSYLVPSSYVDVLYPTIYSAPSVLSPTVYVEPTAYVVTGRRTVSRPIYTRTSSVYYDLRPTTYTYWPTTTTLEVPLLSTTSVSYADDCVVTASAPVSSAPATSSAPNRTQGTTSAPPSNVQSTPRNGSAAPANAGGYPDQGPAPAADDLFNTAPPSGAGGPVEPPLTPTPEKDNGGLAIPPADSTSPASPPLDQYSRTVNRPAPTDFNPQASNVAPGALRGEVVSRETKTPLAGVTVIFSDLQHNYADKEVKTDTSGHFEVLLPNADWSIAIAETGDRGNTQYGRITSTGGRFYDSFDRAISSLRLNH